MASINMCERCPSMATGNAIGELSLITSGEYNGEAIKMELCPGCIGEIVAFVEMKPEREHSAYRNAWKRPVIDPESADTMKGVSTEQLAAELFTRTMKDARAAIEGSTIDG